MYEDSLENSLEEDLDEPFAGDIELDDEPDQTESKEDDFTARDAFLAGSFAGWAYEEGVDERRRKRLLKEQFKRRKRKKFSDDSE